MIVSTKLHIPRARSTLIARPQLVHRLHEGLNHVLTLVTAPAGYGKTTLLSEWAMAMHDPVAWVSLDRGDNDRMRFWTHTIAALKQAYPAFDEQSVLRFASEDASGDSLIAALVNGLHRVSHTIVLIWDDFHHIEETAIQSGIMYLLNRLPQHIHLYITSRVQPALSLSRLRVEGDLNHLEANDLRLGMGETSDFFAKCGGMILTEEETSAIQVRTEGWIAAMRLAVLTLQDQADPKEIMSRMAGTERDISNYFFEEVLSRQSETMIRFLLQTAILERMTGELCSAVTGIVESAAYLQQLELEGLFVVSLDDHRQWYRYHHLFQQFLLAQLQIRDPQRWQTLHLAAGRWLEERGYPREAVDHYLASANYDHVLSLLETIAPELMIHEWKTVCTWLSAIPDSLLLTKPSMLLTKLAAQYLAGQTEAATDGYWQAVRWLKEGTSSLHPAEEGVLHTGLAFLAAFRTFLDRDFEYAVQYSREYVQKHPEGNLFIGIGSDLDGYHPAWDVYISDDGPRLAEEMLSSLLTIWSETQNAQFIAHLNIDYGKLEYERNHLSEAERYMRQAQHISMTHDNFSLTVIASLWLARIATLQGDGKAADAIIRKIAEQTELRGSRYLSGKVSCFTALIGRMQGDDSAAKRWLRTSGLRYRDEIPLSMIQEYDLLAVLLAERGQTEKAAALVERLLHVVGEAGRQGDRIRLLVHQSRILYLQGKAALSMDILEEALAQAQPEGYIRTLVDEGASLGQLLGQYLKLRRDQHIRSGRKVSLSYVERLQQLIFSSDQTIREIAPEERYMPALTDKERSVLRLIEAGMSNREIALRMNISLATVKTHINNMYGKLQVKDRLQALERARTLELF